MRIVKLCVIFVVCACAVLVTGCVSEREYEDLRIQNDRQGELIGQLKSDLDATKLKLGQLREQLDYAKSLSGIEEQTLREQAAACEEDLAKKRALIARMQEQLLGGVTLPVELSTMLEDFAEREGMVTYDASRGIVKFKSDLLFEKGSDVVALGAVEAVKALCGILNSEQGKEFDVIIAGHTDDIPIARAETRRRHPTNWHLSAHRAISVLKVMGTNNIDSKRMSARGFGEFRPVAPNKPGKKGNPQNRRVEIYIVAKGM